MRDLFVKELYKVARRKSKILLLTGDLGFGVLNPFWKNLPNQIINLGIAEQNMIGFSAGLAKAGYTPFVYSIANFPSLRPLEQIRNDVAYHNLNVKIVSVGTGLSYGSLGISHFGTEDLAVMRSIPNIRIYSPTDNTDVVIALHDMLLNKGPGYIRIGRNDFILSKFSFNFFNPPHFKALFIKSQFCIICHGEISNEIEKLKLLLDNKSLIFSYYFINLVKPLNSDLVNHLFKEHNFFFIIEEHNKFGGLSSAIKDSSESFLNKHIFSLSINDTLVSDVGTQEFLRSKLKLDANSLFTKIINVLQNVK